MLTQIIAIIFLLQILEAMKMIVWVLCLIIVKKLGLGVKFLGKRLSAILFSLSTIYILLFLRVPLPNEIGYVIVVKTSTRSVEEFIVEKVYFLGF